MLKKKIKMANGKLSRKIHGKSPSKNRRKSNVLKETKVKVAKSKHVLRNSSKRPSEGRTASEETTSKSRRLRDETEESPISSDISNRSINCFESTDNSHPGDISCTSNDSHDFQKLVRKKSTAKARKSARRRAVTVAPISIKEFRSKPIESSSTNTSTESPRKLPIARMNSTVQVASSHKAIAAINKMRRNTTSEGDVSSCEIFNAVGEQIPSSKWSTLRDGRNGHRIEFVPSPSMRERGVTVTQEVLSEQLNISENDSTMDFIPKCHIRLDKRVKKLVYIQGREPENIVPDSNRDFLVELAGFGSIFAAEV